MSTYLILVNVQGLSVLLSLVTVLYIFFNWKNRAHSLLLVYSLGTLINNLGYTFEMQSTSSEQALMATKFTYLGKSFLGLAFFLFILEYCNVEIKRALIGVLTTFHALLFFSVITYDSQKLYYTGVTFTQEGLYPHNIYSHGIVYYIFMSLNAIYIICGVLILIKKMHSEGKGRRKSALIVLFCAAMSLTIGFLLFIFHIVKQYDVTCLSYIISMILMFICIVRLRLMDTVALAKEYAIDNLSEGIIAVNEEDKVVYYNYPAQKLYPQLISDSESVVSQIKKYIEEGKEISFEERIYIPETRPMYQDEINMGTIYVLKDETERINYTKDLEQQKELAEEANASKSRFLSVVSHEIRTPMNAVVSMTNLMLQDKASLSQKQEKNLTNMKTSGQSLVMIVNDLLDQSKLEAGKMEIIEDPYDIRSMVDDVKMIIENRLESKNVHVIITIDDDIPKYLIGDSLRIRQILINLMNNAVKFTDEGYIELKIEAVDEEPKKRYLKFTVKDSGQGIREKDLKHLGEAFAQVDKHKNHGKEGTGLGLSISKDFINLMGGQLQVDSVYGQGSEFYFSIWQGVASNHEAENSSSKQAWRDENQIEVSDARILVVDDTPINLMIAEEILKPWNITVDKSTSGKRAIEMIKNIKYDMVFMDYMMPNMDGVEVTKIIRSMSDDGAGYLRNVPIIALTGDTSDETAEQFKLAGIDDFTIKPLEGKRVVELLIKWLPKEKITIK